MPDNGTGLPAAGQVGSERTGAVRIAAVGDLHMRPAVAGRFRPSLLALADRVDALLLAGDLTEGGRPAEAELLCRELAGLPVPCVGVLGNHDHDEGFADRLTSMLIDAGVVMLEGGATAYLDARGTRLGIAGIEGGGGGFPGADRAGYPLDEEQEQRLRQGPEDAERLGKALTVLDADVRVVLMHFAPITETLRGEPVEIYPGLGCHDLGGAVDRGGADLVVHGHAHHGSERGRTAGGVPVRNVAYPVLRRPYAVYEVDSGLVRDVC